MLHRLPHVAVVVVSIACSLVLGCGGDESTSSSGSSSGTSGNGSSGTSGNTSSGTSGNTSSGTSGNTSTSSSGSSGTALGEAFKGVATFYDATGAGNCSYPASPQDLDVVAMNTAQYDNSNICGTCIKVEGPKATITVRVVDQCPGCGVNHIDLSESAFAKIAEPIAGKVPVTWTPVACSMTTPVTYHVKEGSSKFWTAVSVRNHKLPITKVEMQKAGTWVNAPRANYNYFIIPSGIGTDGAFRIRVTAKGGEVLEDELGGPQPGKLFTGAKNFQ